MAEPYSADLRERVLLAYEAGLLPAAVARGFGAVSRGVSLAPPGTRGGPSLCPAARRRWRAGDRPGGRGDLAGAGGGAERSYA